MTTNGPQRAEGAIWFLILALFGLGAFSLAASFLGDDENPLATAATSDSADADPGAADNGGAAGEGSLNPANAQTRADRFTISASGDILIHERVAEAATTPTGYDFTPLFAPVQNLIASRDFAICHLEVPISSTNTDLAYSDGVFRAPTELAAALKAAEFDTCSVASNHAWDSGEASVISTIAELQAVEMPHVGIANTPEEAQKTWQFNVLGNIIGHLSYTYGLNGREPGEVPTTRVAQIDEQTILADAQRQRDAGSEFVIVSLHWGDEMENELNEQQADLGPRLLASPNIDLIIGHHAHVPQEIQEIDGEYIAYGLGNLLSNQSKFAPECPNACALDSQDGVLLDFVVERNSDDKLVVTDVIANPTWVDVGGTWKIISTDNPPTVGVTIDPTTLQESGQRTRATLGIDS